MLGMAYWAGIGAGVVATFLLLKWVRSIAADSDRSERHLAKQAELLEEQTKVLREVRDALKKR